MHQTNKQKRDAINTTEKFKTAIVSEVLSSVIAKKLGSAGELLAEEGKLKKDAVNKDMETVGYNLKVANILKLEDRVMGRAQELLNSPLKDVDFRRSYQKTADKFKERTVIKAEAVTHAIDFGKLMK